jgi:hypothetical protein
MADGNESKDQQVMSIFFHNFGDRRFNQSPIKRNR